MKKYLRFNLFFKRKRIFKRLKKSGSNFVFDPHSTIPHPELISVGNNVFIGEKAHISAEVTIGNNVMFGPRPMILGGNHLFAIAGKSVRFLKPEKNENIKQITIEDETWFGAGVIILGGVTVGLGSVVGAGAVVAKDIPPFTVAVGNPAKPIKKIFSDRTLTTHLQQLGYHSNSISEILSRRNEGITALGLSKDRLPVLDKTKEYQDHSKS